MIITHPNQSIPIAKKYYSEQKSGFSVFPMLKFKNLVLVVFTCHQQNKRLSSDLDETD